MSGKRRSRARDEGPRPATITNIEAGTTVEVFGVDIEYALRHRDEAAGDPFRGLVDLPPVGPRHRDGLVR